MTRRVIRFEWDKWRARRENWAMAAFFPLATFGLALLSRAVADSALPLLMSAPAGAEPTGYHLAYRTCGVMFQLLGLILLFWGASSVAAELESGTLRGPLLRVPRHAIPLGKAVFLTSLGAGFALTTLVAAIAAGACAYGLEGARAGQITLHGARALLASGVLATLLTLLPLASLVSVAVSLSCLARTSYGAITMTCLVGAFLWAATLLPGIGPFLFPATFRWPLSVALSQSEGLKTMSYGQGLLRHCAVNLVWIALPMALGVVRLERRDLPL